MTTIKRIIAALIASMVIFITTYNTYTFSVNATSIVVGGATVSLVELIGGFLACLGVSYLGSQVDTVTIDDYMETFDAYLDTVDGTSAVINYIDNLPTYTVLGGNKPKPPKNPDEIRAIQATGIYFTSELLNIAKDFFEYVAETDTDLGAAINDAAGQDVYLTNPMLPENVYIGFNSSLIPGYAVMNGYDASLSHVQYNSPSLQGYVAVQTPLTAGNSGIYHWISSIYLDFKDTNFSIYSGSKTYYYNPNNMRGGYNIGNLSRAQSTHCFTSSGSTVNQTAYSEINVSAYPVYLAPTLEQLIVYTYQGLSYTVLPTGEVSCGGILTAPSGVVTDAGALSSVKPIVGKDLASYIKSIGDNMIDPDVDPALDPVVYTPQAINEIYNNASNYYDQTVQNYYSDPQYITENEYVTNVTNIYQQAAAENPVPDPSVPVSPSLGDLGDYKVTGLSDVFPFCIPFDMYDLLTILAADPKAISFDYTFYFGEDLGEYTINIDLSVFDPVLQVVRTMELLLYIFGLMLVTRNLIRG